MTTEVTGIMEDNFSQINRLLELQLAFGKQVVDEICVVNNLAVKAVLFVIIL